MSDFIRFSRTLSRHKTRVRCRVQKLPRVSCYKILPLTFPPSQNGPGGALCGVLASGNIVCRLCAGTRHRGAEIGALWGLCPAGVFCPCHAAPTTKTSQPGGRLTRAGPGHSRQRVTVRGCGLARCRVMKPARVKGRAMPPQALELPGVAGAGADTFPKQRFRKLPPAILVTKEHHREGRLLFCTWWYAFVAFCSCQLLIFWNFCKILYRFRGSLCAFVI